MPGGGFSRIPPSVRAQTPEPQDDGRFTLGSFSIDEYKPIKVIVIGAGFSGILAGIRFPQKIPNVDLAIYEKSAGIGGTWYNNRYPGVACDVPAHCYQFSFEGKRDWSAFYSPGHEIQAHLQDVVDKYELMRYIKLSHEVIHARYDEPTGKWHVRVRRTETQEEFEDVADVLVTAFGALTRWKMPDIPGLNEYTGELHHTAGYKPTGRTWESDLERWKDKRVGVIGSGSTAIQVVSALAPHVASLANYVRGQTWLAPPFLMDMVQELLGRTTAEDDLTLRPEEVERFKNDREYFDRVRHMLENSLNVSGFRPGFAPSTHAFTQRDSTMQSDFQKMFRKIMEDKLAARPHIAEKRTSVASSSTIHLAASHCGTLTSSSLLSDPGIPSVSCRRLTPGPGYLEALCLPHVDFVSSPIKRFTKTGIETEDGQTKDLDLVFCATGVSSPSLPIS
uniref:FAD-binding monooxygenase BOA2 ) n=1 Tax=Ganoderma boninense TaxID=34458 RepID=A0A5K1JT42_9APHY|nr:FAD-binding monooxygenase BOA2 (EC (Botcinic acid biosynthesis cluster A protein 2) [Ganoderma boninense]